MYRKCLFCLWELAASHKRARCTLRFMHQFLRCPQQHGRGALVSRPPAKSTGGPHTKWPSLLRGNPPATGRDQPAASSQSQRRQLGLDSYKYRARNTQTSFNDRSPHRHHQRSELVVQRSRPSSDTKGVERWIHQALRPTGAITYSTRADYLCPPRLRPQPSSASSASFSPLPLRGSTYVRTCTCSNLTQNDLSRSCIYYWKINKISWVELLRISCIRILQPSTTRLTFWIISTVWRYFFSLDVCSYVLNFSKRYKRHVFVVCTFNDFRMYADDTFHVLVTLSAERTPIYWFRHPCCSCSCIRLKYLLFSKLLSGLNILSADTVQWVPEFFHLSSCSND